MTAVAAAPTLDIDFSAFERAAALLARNEHLDDDGPPPPKSGVSKQPGGASKQPPSRRPRPPPAPRKPPSAVTDTPPANLPSLSELSQTTILDKPKAANHGRRAGGAKPPVSAAESRKATMNAMDAAMPSLDEESARLVARARALLDSNGTDPACAAPSPQRSAGRRGGRVPGGTRSSASAGARLPTTAASRYGATGGGSEAAAVVIDADADGAADADGVDEGGAGLGAENDDGGTAAVEGDEGGSSSGGGNALAFERAAALLARNEHLDDDGPPPPKSGVLSCGDGDVSSGGFGGGLSMGGGGSLEQYGGYGGGGQSPVGSPGGAAQEGASAAQQRVRQARLAADARRKEEERREEERRAAQAGEGERVRAFQDDVRKRNAMRKREEREREVCAFPRPNQPPLHGLANRKRKTHRASSMATHSLSDMLSASRIVCQERDATRQAEELANRQARLAGQAVAEEARRRDLNAAIAERRAQAKRDEARRAELKEVELAVSKARNAEKGMALQAAALARVRGRKKILEQHEGFEEVRPRAPSLIAHLPH